MRNLVRMAREALEAGESCILCTVVRLDGSGYGQPGSRLLVTQSGERWGYISGGCLEKDLLRQVWSHTTRGPALLAFDTRGNSVSASRYHTGCEGVVYVLCQRLTSTSAPSYQTLVESQLEGKRLRIATVYRSDSQDARLGDLWVDGDESRITGGSPPATIMRSLREATTNHTLEFYGCDGSPIEVAIEILKPPQALLIFGVGNDVAPLVAAANLQEWSIQVAGRRPELAVPARFPGAKVICGPWENLVEATSIHSETEVVMMTHDLEADLRLLPRLLDSPARSIGILGPKRRLGRLVHALYQQGRTITPAEAERIRSPIGLDIGAASPAEVAAAIIAEIIALRHNREGGHLFNRSHPIHDREDHQILASGQPAAGMASPLYPDLPLQEEICPSD